MSIDQRMQPRVSSALSVKLRHERRDKHHTRLLQNVSVGGIACFSEEPVPTGEYVGIELSIGGQTVQLQGKVVWCRAASGHYELGLRFEESKTDMRARMVRDLAEIERYRHEVLILEGRQLSSDAAALEWMTGPGAAMGET